jgi:hypothetical protein
VILVTSPSKEYTELADHGDHTSECIKAVEALIKYTARTKKKEVRAIEKKEKEAKKKVVAEPAYVTINLSPKKNEPAVRPPRNIRVSAPEAATEHSIDAESDEENYEDQGPDYENYEADGDGEVEVIVPIVEQELSNASLQPVVPSEEVVPTPGRASCIVYAPSLQVPQMVTVVMPGKRKVEGTISDQTPSKRVKTGVVLQNNPEPAPKKRVTGKPKITVNFGEEVAAGTSAPLVQPVVEAAPRVAKVAKRKIAVKAGLSGKIQQMREEGF